MIFFSLFRNVPRVLIDHRQELQLPTVLRSVDQGIAKPDVITAYCPVARPESQKLAGSTTVTRALCGHPDSSGHPDGRCRVPAPGDELREVVEDMVAGLRGLGWTKEEATAHVARAHARLRETFREPIDVQTLLSRAVRG